MLCICSPNEREVIFIRNKKTDPTIFTLQKIAFVMVVKLRHDNMGATHQPDLPTHIRADMGQGLRHPWPRSIDQRARKILLLCPVPRNCDPPEPADTLRIHERGTGQNARPPLRSIPRIQAHKPRIINPNIRIFEGALKARVKNIAFNGTNKL